MRDDKDIAIQQRMAAQSGQGLSSTPYYIQSLERKIETLNYKLDLILKKLEES